MKGGEKVKKILISNKVLILLILGSLIFISMSAVSAASGDKIYVSGSSGNDSWDGLTPQTAKLSIKNATKTVNTGGTVYVFEGTYSGSNNSGITIDHDMTVNGVGKDKTIISGLDSAQIFRVLSGVTLDLKNLTITNAKSKNGGAIINFGTTNIDGCKFTKCYTDYGYLGGGAAISNVDGATLYVQNSDFLYNNANASSTGGGGAIMTNSTVALQNCTFIGNSAYSGGAIYVFDGDIEINGCSFINNTAKSAGGAIELYSIDRAINIHYSSFTGNSATNVPSTNNIDNRLDNALNVNSNWWGTNSGPRGIDGSKIATNWIYMTLDVNPNNIKVGKTSNVTVNFNHLYDGTTVTDIDPAQAHIPDGTIVNFTTDIGNIDPTTAGTVNGIATAIYNGTTVGIANVNAANDSQQLSKTVTVNPINTQITVQNITSKHGNHVNLTATLKDENNNPLANKTIIFMISGKTIGTAVTNSNGIATLSYTIQENIGSFVIYGIFNSESIYTSSVGNGTLAVNAISTQITTKDVTVQHGNNVNLTTTLRDENNKPIAGQTIIFSINNKIVGAAFTNINGIATFSYLPVNSGNFIVTAQYQGNNIYSGISGFSNLNVTPFSHVYLTANSDNKNPKVGETFTITYKMGNNGPDTAQNVSVSFKIPNGLEFVSAAVDIGSWKFNQSTGTVTWTIDNVVVGDPRLYLTLKALNSGSFAITPDISANTTINVTNNGNINIDISNNSNNGTNGTNNSTNLPNTGIPIYPLIIGIIMVVGGIAVKK